MTGNQLEIPVTFIIFNRPELTQRTFAQIANARPKKLLVIADGPRESRPGEAEKCAAARDVIRQVDWDCEVLTQYSNENLGCKRRVSSGLDWVFQTVEEAIILEDDCVPDPTFFPYCAELLDRYREDERVAIISGDNLQFGQKRTEDSYYFSVYPHIWGWASWRRVWQNYDVKMQSLPQTLQQGILKGQFGENAGEYWSRIFYNTYQDKINSWAYPFAYMCFMQHQACVIPGVNLVSNSGFGEGATHTMRKDDPQANMKTEPMVFPMVHPKNFTRNFAADQFTQRYIFGVPEPQPAAKQRQSLSFDLQRMRTYLPEDVKRATMAAVRLLVQEAEYQQEFGSEKKAQQLYRQALDRTAGHPAFRELAGQLQGVLSPGVKAQ